MGKKKISTGVWLLGLLIVFCSYTGVAGAKNRSKTKTVTKSVPLGDPFILLHDGTYYAYGMHAADGIEVYIFPNITFETYTGLLAKRGQEVIKEQYGMIVSDELHRTGAKEWCCRARRSLPSSR